MASIENGLATTIIRDPRVYLVGRQTVDDEALAAFLADHDARHWATDTDEAGEKLIEVAGRTCYMSFARPRPGGNSAYIRHLLEVGHGSVLEHAVFNLIIAGVSRSFTHELIRHRAGFGYSQLSQRFVDESECGFVEPEAIAEDPELHRVWLEAVQSCQRAYQALADGLAAKFAHLEDRTLRRKKRARRRGASYPTPRRPRFSSPPTPGPCGTSSRCAATRRPTSRSARWRSRS